ncbi:MAG: CRISPR-associated protein Cas4 [Bacillota bacterium]|nr:CRISPR-associated protein Cas4 [Bacillota bacterium]
MRYDEEDCLPISGIQHFTFCRRQYALIHIERLWVENTLTFDGRVMHRQVEDPFYLESRGTVIVSRSVPLISTKLGLYGIADVVEFRSCEAGGVVLEGRKGMWQPYPVEYKRGRGKPDDRDIVQVGAQAMCLEEMLHTAVSEGALYYGQTRRRQMVLIDDSLRSRVTVLAQQMHDMYDSGRTPAPTKMKACDRCSLRDLCLPKISSHKRVGDYIRIMSKEKEVGNRPL